MMRPLIACTTTRTTSKMGVVRAHLSDPYSLAVEAAGGVPIPFSPALSDATLAEILHLCDGLMLTGGGDVHSVAWGEPLHPAASELDADRDAQEVALVPRALSLGIPVFGICRGMQVVNVALGGTLHQHLSDVPGVRIEHKQPRRRREKVHSVSVEGGSLTARCISGSDLRVNTSHHQGIAKVAPGLSPTAWSSDGVIEALEPRDGRLPMLLVQWHPEEIARFPEQARLFEWLVAAARKRRRSRTR